MSENSIVVRGNGLSMADAQTAAIAMAKSGFFQDVKDANQALVKILAGQEMGFGAFASLTGVYIIQGRPSIGANLMAAAVKRSGKYDYRVLEMTEQVCEIAFYQSGKEIGRSRFTLEDARKAGTKNLDKYARNMLFARSMSNGVKWFVPDIFNGAPVYTPEELGAETDQDGNILDVTPTLPAPTTTATVTPPAPQTMSLRYTPEQLKGRIAEFVKTFEEQGFKPTVAQRQTLPGNIEMCFPGMDGVDKIHHSVTKYLVGKVSTKDMTDAEVMALRKWLNVTKDSGGEWLPDALAAKEAAAIWRQCQIDNGQRELIGSDDLDYLSSEKISQD